MHSAQDILLKLGASLKAGRYDEIVLKTPAGEPVLFRAQGLQVIRSEADEIDTGKTCTLVITPLAPLVSGVLVRVLRMYRPVVPPGQFQVLAAKLIEKVKSKAASQPSTWEDSACLDLIAFAMEVKVLPRRKGTTDHPKLQRESQGSFEDPFTGEVIGRWASAYSRLRSTGPGSLGMADEVLDDTLGKNVAPLDSDLPTAIVKVAGISGLVVSGYWVPVLGPSVVLRPDTEDKVARGLSRKGLNPQLALLALANLRLRDQLRRND